MNTQPQPIPQNAARTEDLSQQPQTVVVESLPKSNPFSGLVGRFTAPRAAFVAKTVASLALVVGLGGATTYITLTQLRAPTSTTTQAHTQTDIEIMSPKAGQTYSLSDPIATNIYSDDLSQFSSVQFNLNGEKLCTKTAAPYNCSLNGRLRPGLNQLEVVGTDREGQVHIDTITFTVQ